MIKSIDSFSGYVFIGLEKETGEFFVDCNHKDLTDDEREDLASVVINFNKFASGEIIEEK